MIGKRAFCSLLKYSKATNPRVWLSINDGEKDIGNLEFELYSNQAPNAVENFRQLCTSEDGYAGSTFDNVIDGFIAQGGSTDGDSIYGERFADENLNLRHTKRGTLAMSNTGPNSNGTRFYVTFIETPWLNGYNQIIGELTNGDDVLSKIEAAGSRSGEPSTTFTISKCGEF